MENRVGKQFEGFLKTPPLWINPFQEIEQFKLPGIEEPLTQSLTEDLPSLSSNFVMGKRVERFFEWIIRQNSNYNLLAENMQISRHKITLGELDFLIEDLINRQVFHIEMVYKFYVYDPSFTSENQQMDWSQPPRYFTTKNRKTKRKTVSLTF